MREELEKLIAEATPGDLSTAELSREEVIECPVCGGDGEVDAVDYCNFDHKALGVQFYGIGKEFGAHEKLWSYFMNNAPAIVEALTERASMAAEIERLRGIVRGWHYLAVGPDEMGDYYTHKQLIKLSEPYASPSLKALEARP